MSIILKGMQVISKQPLAVGTPFQVRLELERFPPGEADHPTSVKLWCESAYQVSPGIVPVSIPNGADTSTFEPTVVLSGSSGSALVRILGQCDEVHSLVVEVR